MVRTHFDLFASLGAAPLQDSGTSQSAVTVHWRWSVTTTYAQQRRFGFRIVSNLPGVYSKRTAKYNGPCNTINIRTLLDEKIQKRQFFTPYLPR